MVVATRSSTTPLLGYKKCLARRKNKIVDVIVTLVIDKKYPYILKNGKCRCKKAKPIAFEYLKSDCTYNLVDSDTKLAMRPKKAYSVICLLYKKLFPYELNKPIVVKNYTRCGLRGIYFFKSIKEAKEFSLL